MSGGKKRGATTSTQHTNTKEIQIWRKRKRVELKITKNRNRLDAFRFGGKNSTKNTWEDKRNAHLQRGKEGTEDFRNERGGKRGNRNDGSRSSKKAWWLQFQRGEKPGKKFAKEEEGQPRSLERV